MDLQWTLLSVFLPLFTMSVNTNTTEFGYEGDTVKLICPLRLLNGTRTTWFGPPNSTAYFYNEDKNPFVVRGDRLSVIKNDSLKTYALQIANITEGVDNGSYSCVINTNPAQQHNVLLKFYIDVKNVSLIPSNNPLTIREGTQREVQCVVNKDVDPAATFKWYIDSTDSTNIMGQTASFIKITGDREDNNKALQCKATNNGEREPKTADTVLNIEYPPSVKPFPQQNVIEGNNLSVTCEADAGNPSSTTFFWSNNAGFRQNGRTLYLPNLQRNSFDTYRCTAQNNYGFGVTGSTNQSMFINVLYPPTVNTMRQHDVIEGRDLSANCTATPGNPNSTTFYWTKEDDTGFIQNGATLKLHNIQRNSSGTYICTAVNIYKDKDKGTNKQPMVVNVQYPPYVNTMQQQDVIEGRDLSVNCTATPGNPNSTTFYWTKVDSQEFRQDGSALQLYSIQRNSSGTYRCTAVNIYKDKDNGTHSRVMVVNVQFHPSIESKPHLIVNESEDVTFIREISSNPLSNVYWYIGTLLLKTEIAVKTATFKKENVTCTDTKNFTLVASNGIGNNSTAWLELIVNCEPKPDKKNITLGVTETTGLRFSSTVLAFPEPWFEFKHENGTINEQLINSTIRNAVNNFTIYFNQTVVEQGDYGTYHLKIGNHFGVTTVFVNVLAQRKPYMPIISEVVCEVTQATVKWKSTFNGGDDQSFTAIALNGLNKESDSGTIADKGETKLHSAIVQNLRPSTKYLFYVSTYNRHGESLSNNISCTTEENNGNFELIAGGAAAGGIFLAIIIIVIVILLRNNNICEKQTGKSQRLDNEVVEKEEENDDGMRDNILYVSAGPKVDEKPEAAVYAAVNKKAPESNNNANMYAEVNKGGHLIAEGALYSDVKPKRGLFKKDVGRKRDGNPKQKKGKKQKSKQDVADVYENSEDIAMSSKSDNVYFNTGQKVQNKEERGYKNKDGLLYVEVQFDTKNEKGNQTVHGEDEKTDYATVEFPMAASTHDESGNEKI